MGIANVGMIGRSKYLRKEILALAVSAIILSSIFVPFQSVSAVHIDVDNTPIQAGGNTAIGLKITAQSPGAVTFPSGDKNETIPNGEIRVTVDSGTVSEKIVTFDFNGNVITDTSAGAITGLTFAGITHGVSNTAGSFGSGPYYGYGLIYHQTPNTFSTGQLGNGTLVTGISSKPYNEDTTGSYSIHFDPTKLSTGSHDIRVDVLAKASDTTMFSSGNISFANNAPSSGTITVITKIIGGSATLSDFAPIKVNSTTVTNGTATSFSPGLYVITNTPVTGYFLSNGGDCPSGSLALGSGEDKTCIITETFETSPVVTITSPANGTTFGTGSVPVSGTASVAIGSITSVEYSVDGGSTTPATGTDNWSLTTSGLSSGSHEVIVTAHDSNGHSSIAAVHFTVDTTAPTVTISSPADGTSQGNNVIHLVGTTTDGTTGIASVKVSVDAGSFALATTSDNYANWSFDTSILSDGPHLIIANVTDNLGHFATSSVTITTDTTSPTVTIDSPTDGSTIQSNHFTISGTVGDNVLLDHLIVTVDGNQVSTTGSWSADSGTLSDGSHDIVATATDKAGNSASSEIHVTTNTAASISLDRSSGSIGDTVGVSGTNFTPNTTVHITISGVGSDVKAITSDGTGSFSTTFTVPSGATSGQVTANDGTHTVDAPFTVNTAMLNALSPVGGSTGVTVTISGDHFIANAPITIKFNNSPVTATVSDNTGSFTTTFTVPSVSSGSYTVTASDGTNTQSTLFGVGTSITLNPTSGLQGTKTTISGTGFAPSSPLHIIFAGQHITLPNAQNSTKTGSFSVQVVVPSQADVGPNTVSVSDGVNSASAQFTVPQPTITLSPDTGLAGSKFKITGTNFVPGVPYFISFNGTTLKFPGANHTNTNGGFTTPDLTVPGLPQGVAHVIVHDNTGSVASADFTIHGATITVTPTVGPQGKSLTITGEGFSANSALTVKFNGTIITPNPAPKTTGSGKLPNISVKVPNILGGTATITVTDSSLPTPLSASKQFTVTPASITLTPTSGLDNDKVKITATGFAPNTSYHVSFNGTLININKVNSTGTGAFSTTFNVPTSSPDGIATVTVSDTAPVVSSVSQPFTVLPAAVTLTPASGPLGTAVKISAVGFDTKVSYHVSFNGTLININKVNSTGTTGAFTTTFNVPTKALGIVPVTVSDDGTNHISVTKLFEITAPSLSVNPASALPGDTIKLTGAGFNSKVSFRISFNGTANIKLPGTNATNSDGTMTASFKVPLSASVGNAIITVTDNGAGHISASTPFAVKAGFITLSPTSGVPGTTLKITAAGFESNAKFFITFNGTTIKLPGTNTTGTGAFTASFKTPQTSSGVATITVHDNGVNHVTASAQFTVPQQSITISPTSGPQQTQVTVQGSGFASSSAMTLKYDSKDITPNNLKTDNKGTFKATFKVPPSTSNVFHTITATDASAGTATAQFFKVLPFVSLSQNSGPAGTVVVISGQNFTPSQKITITSDGDPITVLGSAIKTNSNGAFTASVQISSLEDPDQSIALTVSDGVNHTYQVFTIPP